jgi:Eukaryotic DNA topoisomerase I, catalytic core
MPRLRRVDCSEPEFAVSDAVGGSRTWTRTTGASPTARRYSAFARSRSRLPGRTSGSARTRTATPRHWGQTRAGAGSTATTTHGGDSATARSSTRWSSSPSRSRQCAGVRRGRSGTKTDPRARPRRRHSPARPRLLPDRRRGLRRENGTYGLATMRKRHVRLEPENVIVFDYWRTAASAFSSGRRSRPPPPGCGARAAVRRQRRAARLRERLPVADVRSSDINEHVKELTGGDFTTRDFRTWSATVLAAVEVAGTGVDVDSRAARKRPSAARWNRSPPTWATPLRSAGPRTSTRASSTGSTPASRSPTR